MFSIGEFSKASGLTVKTLRFYHERWLLVPAEIDRHSGYRRYDHQNLETAQVIRTLRELEFSLDDITTILAECDDTQDALTYLQTQKQALAQKLSHYQNLIGRIDQAINDEKQTQDIMKRQALDFTIQEKTIPEQLIAGIRMQGRYQDCGQGFMKLGKAIGRHINGKAFCLYFDGEYREDDANFETCFPVRKKVALDGIDVRMLPEARAITLVHRGPYDTLRRAYAKVITYANEHGHEFDLPTREVYLKGPGMIFKGNPRKYLTEIQLPIRA